MSPTCDKMSPVFITSGVISSYATYDYYGNAYTSPGMPPMLITSNCDITMILEDGLVTSWKYKGNSCYDY